MLKRLTLLFSILIVLITGTVYLKTLTPTVSWIDSGELAFACATLGIPHPTGYPLYVCWGKSLTLLPFKEPIFALNFLSLFFAVLANLFLFFLFLLALEILFKERNFLRI